MMGPWKIVSQSKSLFLQGVCLALFVFFFVFSAQGTPPPQEEEAYNVSQVTKTVDGLHFIVQEDRPIEKVAGVYRPVDIDGYVAYKFNKFQKAIDELFSNFQSQFDRLAGRLDALVARVGVLEEKTRELSLEVSALRLNQSQGSSSEASSKIFLDNKGN